MYCLHCGDCCRRMSPISHPAPCPHIVEIQGLTTSMMNHHQKALPRARAVAVDTVGGLAVCANTQT